MSDIITFEIFKNIPALIQGISTKAFGSMKDKDLQIDSNNVVRFGKAIGITGPIVCMNQIHSGNVSVITSTDKTLISQTDGMVTNQKHVALAVLTADCLPIFFYDPKNHAIGVAHAGYKGLLNGIIEATITAMKKQFGTNPHDVLVGMGPGIEEKCYEVGDEVIAMFEDKGYDKGIKIWSEQKGKKYLSIRKAALHNLLKEGILKEHIEVSTLCTKCSKDKLYSYRGGDKTGRFAAIFSLI